jgi:hypothetical protein
LAKYFIAIAYLPVNNAVTPFVRTNSRPIVNIPPPRLPTPFCAVPFVLRALWLSICLDWICPSVICWCVFTTSAGRVKIDAIAPANFFGDILSIILPDYLRMRHKWN